MNTSEQNLTNYSSSLVFEKVPAALTNIQATVVVVAAVLGLGMNVFSLAVVLNRRKLREQYLFEGIFIPLVDVLWIVTTHTAVIATAVSRQWVLGGGGCTALGFFGIFFPLLRCLLLTVKWCDRLCTVFITFKYPHHRVKILAVKLMMVFALALLYPLISASTDGWLGQFTLYHSLPACYLHWSCHHSRRGFCYAYHAIFAAVILLMCPGVSLMISLALWRQAVKLNRQVLPMLTSTHESTSHRTKVNPLPTAWDAKETVSTGTRGTELSHRSSTFPGRSHTKSVKVAVTLSIEVLQHLVFPLFFYIDILINRTGMLYLEPSTQSAVLGFAAADLYLLLPTIDSLVLLKSKEVRKAVQKQCCCCCCCKSNFALRA